MNDDLLRGKVLSSKYLFRKPWLTVRSECLEMPNGKIVPEYFVHEYPEWVNVIAVTNDRKIVMIRQYRHALGRISFEIPAGVCENNDISLEESARRELLEETGLTAHRLELFGIFSGKDTHYVYPNGDEVSNVDIVYLCREYSGELICQEGETDELCFFAADELPENLSPPIRVPLLRWAAGKK